LTLRHDPERTARCKKKKLALVLLYVIARKNRFLIFKKIFSSVNQWDYVAVKVAGCDLE
jgi:hypothetical protein